MNNYKSLKKQLKFCIKTMNDSSSLFVVDSNKDFTRKRKHLFGSTLFNVLLLESGRRKVHKHCIERIINTLQSALWTS